MEARETVAGKYRCRVCLVKCGARSPCSTVLVKVAGKSDRGCPSTSEEPSHLFRRQILKLKSCNNVNKNLMATSANGGTTLALITIAMLGVCIQKVCSGGRDGGVSSSCHSTHCQPHGTSDKDRRKHRLQHKPGSRHRIFYKLQMQSVMPNACPISDTVSSWENSNEKQEESSRHPRKQTRAVIRGLQALPVRTQIQLPQPSSRCH